MAEKVREPRQKRSIEKKRKIVTAGFQLFCEKGYYNTNTAEIAEYAGVSTGTVYSYFSDKADIYIAAFEDYLNEQTKNIMLGLKKQEVFVLHDFINSWIDLYFNVFGQSNKALSELNSVMSKETSLNKHFSSFETQFTEEVFNFLKSQENFRKLSIEKTYLAFLLVDALCKERAPRLHDGIDYNILKNNAVTSIEVILQD